LGPEARPLPGHWSDLVHGRHPYPSAKTRNRLVEVVGPLFEDLFEEGTGPPDSESAFKAALRDRYLVDSEVRRGGMGVVYLARDTSRDGRPGPTSTPLFRGEKGKRK
jgi:hypothetical protein